LRLQWSCEALGTVIALLPEGEQLFMPRFWNAALLGAALITPIAVAPMALRAEDNNTRSYHDKEHNDDHHWDSHEDRAYRMYAKENHRKYSNFSKLRESDQQAYWGWRHEHSDAILKINIR
jgi:Ni/Co efflux regulator RcnB